MCHFAQSMVENRQNDMTNESRLIKRRYLRVCYSSAGATKTFPGGGVAVSLRSKSRGPAKAH